jgi:imidazoleglycerol-phosphate dehydratase
MAADESAGNRSAVRLALSGAGQSHVESGVPVLDRLLEQFAAYGGFELTLGVAPGSADTEVAESGQALGSALAGLLRAEGARGHGSAHVPSAEALAHIALDLSAAPCLVTNFDLSAAHVGGLAGDLADRFLNELALAAGITLHVRLVEGRDTQHVLDAIFKALGVALEAACRVRGEGA